MKDYSLITNRLGLQLKSQLSADKNHNLTETYFVYADDLLSLLEKAQTLYGDLTRHTPQWGPILIPTTDTHQGLLIGLQPIQNQADMPNPVTREELTAINERLSKWGVK